MPADGHIEAVLRPGDLVDHFKVVRLVGRGGMGEVYLARDTKLGRKVALKVVKPENLGDGDSIKRFLFEARVTARFSHPHIVTIHAVGEHDGCPYVALEYLEGQTLRERLEDEKPGVGEALRIGYAIAEALKEAHGHDILHRDLKPENVLLPRDGRIRVVDFGLAKAVFGQGAELAQTIQIGMSLGSGGELLKEYETDAKEIAGTPLYMAPEQWTQKPCTPATDIWALGVVLYEMLSGRRPFSGSNAIALCAAICDQETTAPPLDAPGVSAELAGLVGRCLEKKPTDRPTTAEVHETLARLLHFGRGSLRGEESPFRGLLPFTERQTELFFGREAEIAACVERLRDEAVLPVVGPSGAGKSSFVQAGVIPRLREQGRWVVLGMRPGSKPFEALASRLVRGESGGSQTSTPTKTSSGRFSDADGNEVGQEDLHRRMQEAPGRLGLFLTQVAEEQQSRVLLFVDQLEELYALVDDEDERRRFMEALCLAGDDPEGDVRVVFTVRDDFLGKLAESEAARRALSRVTVLRAPGPEAMLEILSRPLECVGYSYEDEKLAAEMVAAVRGESAGLPLLQFACSLLWERRDKAKKQLTWKAYAAIGGVEGALAHHADGVLEGLTPADVNLAREIFLRLVTGEGTRRTINRGELFRDLGPGAPGLLDRLIQSRIIALRKALEGDTDDAELELAHESLIGGWRRLRRWIEESREDLAFLDEVGKAAELWDRRGRRSDEVWTGDALHDAVRKVERMEKIPALVGDFLKAGEALVGRRARRRRMLVAVTMIALAVVAIVLALQNRETNRQKKLADEGLRLAEDKAAEALCEGASLAFDSEDITQARAKLRGSLEVSDSIAARALWLRLGNQRLEWAKKIPENWTGDVRFSPDGETVAVADGTMIALIDYGTQETRYLVGHEVYIYGIGFAPNGKQLVSVDNSVTVGVWDLETAESRFYRNPGEGFGRCGDISPDGLRAAFGTSKGRVLLFDVASGERRRDLDARAKGVDSVAFSLDGALLAGGTYDGRIVLWSAETGEEVDVLQGHSQAVMGLSFSRDGARMASRSTLDNKVVVWDMRRREPISRIDAGVVFDARLSPDGNLIATASLDGSVTIRDAANAEALLVLPTLGSKVRKVDFSADGQHLATCGEDFVARVWNARLDRESQTQRGSSASLDWSIAFSPDGKQLFTNGRQGVVRVWDVDTGAQVRLLTQLSHGGGDINISGNGKLVSAVERRHLRVWDLDSGMEKALICANCDFVHGHSIGPQGKLVVTGDVENGEWFTRLWSTEDGREILVLDKANEREIDATAFSADGRFLALGSYIGDSRVTVWDLSRRTVFRLLEGLDAPAGFLRFRSDNRTLVATTLGRMVAWDLHDGTARIFDLRSRRGECELAANGGDRFLALCGHGHALWDPERDELVDLSLRRDDYSQYGARFSNDGRLLALPTQNGNLHVVDTETRRPVWFSPVLLASPPAVFTQRGWERLDRPEVGYEPAATAWRRAIEERAETASVSADGRLLCLGTHSADVELWDLTSDRRLAVRKLDGDVSEVLALPAGCLVIAETSARTGVRSARAWIVDEQGDGRVVLDDQTEAIGRHENQLLVATPKKVTVFDKPGVESRSFEADGVSAVARIGEWLALGHVGGDLELIDAESGAERRELVFDDVPKNRVARIIPGPVGTIVAGYANGEVGVWSLESGVRLHRAKLHGWVEDLLVEGDKLFVATSLGDHEAIDLSLFTREYCDLMREVWDGVPVVWEDGRAVVAAPRKDHPCITGEDDAVGP